MKTLPSIQTIVEIFQRDDNCYDTEDSEVSKFFAGKNVFVTGGTGFLGKLLVEKLLRACPQVASLYMLVRTKKGKDVHTRLDEIFNDVVFQKLSKLQPKFRHKVVLVAGDVALPGLGISIEDRQMIIDKVSIFIHSAATVKFHEKMHLAVDINIKGTIEMLNLAKEAKHIDSFIHISTAFSHCYRENIDELVYDVPYDADKIIQISTATPPEILDKMTPDLIGDWPNTYVFTKAIAEDCVRKSAAHLPVCIVRPAIVIATYKEPIKSWIDNIYGATGIVIGSGVGILRAALIDKTKNAEIVPADLVVNCILSATYKTAVERKPEVQVYNFVSSTQNLITWDRFMHLNETYGHLAPSLRSIWIYSLVLMTNKLLYNIYISMFHMIPAFLMDLGLLVIGRKPQMVNVYKKVHKFGDTVSYFGNRNWTFKNSNTQQLSASLSPADKNLFFFDISKLDWEAYFTTHCLGLRTYILKDDLSTIPQARKRYFRIGIAHTALKILGIAIVLKVLYVIIMYLFNTALA